jgi:RNA polymerase sigma factor (sigma-70 family)
MTYVATDAALWARALDGDAEAFGQLYDRHARSIYNFCFRRTADWAIAEDLVAGVFLETWRRRRSISVTSDGTLLPWLYGVATNLVRNQRRARRRLVAATQRLRAESREEDLAGDAADRVEDARRMRAILDLVERLPQREKEVLALCVFAGASYADAATALDVPVGTVRSRLARARERLRELSAAPGHRQGEIRAERGVADDAV